ncbi:hypothetical protein [Neorhizobium sp. AL 9.2.2]
MGSGCRNPLSLPSAPRSVRP